MIAQEERDRIRAYRSLQQSMEPYLLMLSMAQMRIELVLITEIDVAKMT